jgi:hypothetical protein
MAGALSALAAGCATTGASDQAAMPGQLEPIHAAAITPDLAVFWVSSNGCTRKDDLRPVIRKRGQTAEITLRRLDEDRCDRPMSEGLQVEWSFEELGLRRGEPVIVNNPYLLPQT